MQPSTGLTALDKILHGILPGDNIVWQVDSIHDYLPFVKPFCRYAREKREKLVYFRFAKHEPIISENQGAVIHQLHPETGFEKFITEIHSIIEKIGHGGYYIFDSMSELAFDCFSDRMIGNFFSLTCPYLYSLNTIAYFAVFRNYHSFHAAQPIAETTQILLNVYRYKNRLYLHPLKVLNRYSPTMHMLHFWDKEEFVPVTQSHTIAEVLTSAPWPGLQSASYRLIGLWDRGFMHAEEILESYNRGECPSEKVEEVFNRLVHLVISRDERVKELARKYLTLSDIIYIWKRMIGSGMIGGKSVGMLLARAILKKTESRWKELLEFHDSFFIASDVYYTFFVQNGLWWIRQKQKNPDTFMEGAEEARKRIMSGRFPDYIIRRFSDMLDYFGQSPIIVRSSSLLEDAFGNAFAGKYESVFCANQGTIEQRLEEFMNAVRLIYTSTMSEEALSYRASRGVLDKDEQMALLIQRVSGAPYGNLFFPQLSGVGFSFNPYVWNESIKPEAGMIRLVFGLGTRAVDRADDDYTRVVALNAPDKRPEANFTQVRRYSQRRVDILDLEKDRFSSSYFVDIVKQGTGLPVELFASLDRELERLAHDKRMSPAPSWVLTFDKIFSDTPFIKDMREMLRILKEAYGCQVDIEFTTNFVDCTNYKINLLQCRPLQVKETGTIADFLPNIQNKDLVLRANGGIIGQSKLLCIDRIIFVVPSVYGHLPINERYSVARLIGQLTHLQSAEAPKTILLLGPGRWGTSTPSLGVPVSFAEINTVSVICEIDSMHEGLVPDLSLGTHFFNELVEMDMLYIAFFTAKKGNEFKEDLFLQSKNLLPSLLPEAKNWVHTVYVLDNMNDTRGSRIFLKADSIKQRALLYLAKDQN